MATSAPIVETATLASREFIAPGFWLLSFQAAGIAQTARAAQYVAIDVPGDFSVRLPLGIWTARDGEISFLFREWGDRTTRLAYLPIGADISLVGPLGNAFEVPESPKRAVIAAGGLGVVPFWLLVRDLHAASVKTTVVLGARTKELIVGENELRALGASVTVWTDDGSVGERGTVVDGVAREAGPDAAVYGCGPEPMLRALCDYANGAGIPCAISMEETFGCSMGTCWSCVVPLRRGSPQGTRYPRAAGETRDYDFARVCTDGTVFSSKDVLWLN